MPNMLFFDGAEGYSTEEIAGKGSGCWDYVSNTQVLTTGAIRNGGGVLSPFSNGNGVFKKGLGNQSTLAVGVGIYYTAGHITGNHRRVYIN